MGNQEVKVKEKNKHFIRETNYIVPITNENDMAIENAVLSKKSTIYSIHSKYIIKNNRIFKLPNILDAIDEASILSIYKINNEKIDDNQLYDHMEINK